MSKLYVSTSGSDSNTGLSESVPFKTISKAVSIAKAGDTVYVKGGIYNERITMSYSGTLDKPIILQSYENETPVIDGTNISASYSALIRISSKSYIKIIGFEIRNYVSPDSKVAHGILVDGGSSTGVEIRNCRIHDIKTTYSGTNQNRNAHGIAIYGTINDISKPIDGIVLDGNEVYNCKLGQSESIVLNGNVTNFKVTNNRVHDNDNIGIDFIGYEGTANKDAAGVPSAMQDRARNGVCIGNRVWNITSRNNPTYGGDICADGIYVDGGYNILIERNAIDNCDIGIEAASEHKNCSTEKIMIRNNLVSNCRAVGGILFGGAGSSNGTATEIKIYNNTLYNNQPNICIQKANSSTNEIKNNICYPGTFLEGVQGSNIVSGNLTTDPKYVNAPAKNYHLQATSPAIDSGVTVDSGSVDLEGNPRVQGRAVDQGCYEYEADTVPKASVVSSIQAVNITSSSAGITWTTDQNASSAVDYGTTSSYGNSTTGAGNVTSHSISLTGLTAATLYHFRVRSTNSSGQETVSGDATFTTTASGSTVDITVDGNASDWSGINAIAAAASGKSKALKVHNDATYLYLCITGDALDTNPNIELMINTDNNTATGWRGYVKWTSAGCDYTLENTELYRYTGTGQNWRWTYVQRVSLSKTPICIEARVPLAVLGLKAGSMITVGYIGMDRSWNPRECLPRSGALPGYTIR